MRFFLSIVLLMFFSAVGYGQESTQKIGDSYFHSDGSSSQKIGNTTFHSDGSSSQRIGNTTYHWE